MARMKTAVLISGSGTNLQALIDASAQPDFPAEIALVISNRADAKGLERAHRAGIASTVIDHRSFESREAFDAAIHNGLAMADIELVCLAGFMRLFTQDFVEKWTNRILNIHPALLPSFKGLHAPRQALDAGVRISGCTVHIVRPAMDDGPIVVQAAVPVNDHDTEESLQARILTMEHKCYPLAVRLMAEGRVHVVDGRVTIDGPMREEAPIMNPPYDI